ncbi:MAG: dihydropteroate synthase [Kiritimatiellae bacterium]|nr:dihydropteroate synthase [Kiritimatiellia bacterium]
MGILNCTPDSFSDGGRFADARAAVEAGLHMASDGADIIDIGGESSRPGAETIPASEEIRRVAPVIEGLRAAGCATPISIDTCKADVARAALEAGADIINDIRALADPGMAAVARATGAGVVLMHMRGEPRTMQDDPRYGDVLADVGAFLAARAAHACAEGMAADALVLDPGIGFGKTSEHNWALLEGLARIPAPPRPWLIGASRKRLIGDALGRPPEERMAGSLAVAVWAVLRGASIIRTHDVKETCDAVALADRMRQVEATHGVD